MEVAQSSGSQERGEWERAELGRLLNPVKSGSHTHTTPGFSPLAALLLYTTPLPEQDLKTGYWQSSLCFGKKLSPRQLTKKIALLASDADSGKTLGGAAGCIKASATLCIYSHEHAGLQCLLEPRHLELMLQLADKVSSLLLHSANSLGLLYYLLPSNSLVYADRMSQLEHWCQKT